MNNKWITSRLREPSWLVVVLGLTGALTPTTINAQPVNTASPKVKGVSELLSHFEETAIRTGSGGTDLAFMLRDWEEHPRARLDSIVNGFEQIVLHSNSANARLSAAVMLAFAAGSSDRPLGGLLDRVIALYRRTGEPLAQSAIVSSMYGQRDRPRAIAFLKSVAIEAPDRQDFTQASLTAVSTLARMGEDGRAALVELRQSGAVRDPAAKGYIGWFLRP
jgi:hypothetical protein